MSIQDYFQKPDAERFLLLEFQRSDSESTRYYISDAPYTTSPSDTPSNLPYSPVIGVRGIPQLRRTLSDAFRGGASSSFGTVELVDSLVQYVDDSGRGEDTLFTPKGCMVYGYIAAPVGEFPRTDAIPLLVGKVGRTGGDSSGTLTVEITDGSETLSGQNVQVQEKPLSFGYVRNMTPVLIDPSTRTYAVHDSAVEDIVAVYDTGVTLNPSLYTKDLTAGTFTLVNPSTGVITADVKGAKVAGTWLSSTEQIIEHLLDRAGVSSFTVSFDIPSGVIGYLLTQSQEIGSILDELMRGVGGYWIVDRLGELQFKQYPLASGLGSVFTENELIGSVSYEDDFQLYGNVPYSYRNNWTVIQPLSGAEALLSVFFTKEYLEGSVEFGAKNPEFEYGTSPLVKTFFDSNGDASSIANRFLSIYQIPRKIVKAVVPFSETLTIGQTVTLMFNDKEFTGVVTTVVDVFDGNYPLQEIEVLV